jgi:hypothetical protein
VESFAKDGVVVFWRCGEEWDAEFVEESDEGVLELGACVDHDEFWESVGDEKV